MRAALLLLALLSAPACAETIYLGPEGRTAGATGIATRTEITELERFDGGAAGRLRHTELQSGWSAAFAVDCPGFEVRYRQEVGQADITIRVTAEVPVLVLRDGAHPLATPEEYRAAMDAAVDSFGTGQATWIFIRDMPRIATFSGLLIARACTAD